MDPRTLWQAVQTVLRSKMSPATFDTWLRPTTGLDISGNTLVIGVPSSYAEDWITQRLNGDLSAAIESVTGGPMAFRLVVSPGSGADAASVAGGITPNTLEQAHLPDPEASAPMAGKLRLNPRYTFDTFVVGPGNRLAHAAAQAVAEFPAAHYNPLFIYGGVGLGKTHLLNAIAHVALQRGHKVRMLSSESFTNELINAIRSQSTEAFRQTYRAADVLLLDDIHFIAGKESTQEEFFHTFNAVHGADGQIVVTSDRPPHAIATLEDRLRSRFQWGLQVDVQPPDLETRIAILREKNLRQPQPVSDAVIQLIAQAVQQNVRELEGALNRVVAYTKVNRLPLTAEVAARALEDLMIRRAPPDPEAILRAVASYYSLDRDELVGPRRSVRVVEPRQVAMYLIREETEASYPAIGALIGGRDHTTVLHGYEKIRRLAEQDPKLSRDILQLRQRIYGS